MDKKDNPAKKDWRKFDFGNEFINELVSFLLLIILVLLWIALGPIYAVVMTVRAILGLEPPSRNPFNTSGRW